MSAEVEAELVLGAGATLGEGPVWDDREQRLWWVDITAGVVHRTDPATGADERFEPGGMVGAVGLRADGDPPVAASTEGFLDVVSGLPVPMPALPLADRVRPNDAKPDPGGRFVVGSMGLDAEPGAGALHRVGPDGVVELRSGLTIANGIDWIDDGATLLHIDTPDGRVRAFPYGGGTLGPGRVVVEIPQDRGALDGMCVDAEGGIWVALWGGGEVQRFVDGRPDTTVRLPTPHVTCPCFGGPELDRLFVTTARQGLGPDDRGWPGAGHLYRADVGVRGRPPHRLRFAS